MAAVPLALVLLIGSASLLPSAEQISGGWSATAGERTIGGSWTGKPHDDKDAAWGAWTLRDASGKRILSGSWVASKVGDKWQGQWRADVGNRGSYSGSWTADAKTAGSSPMYELLRESLESVVRGTWGTASNQTSGNWAIQAWPEVKPPAKKRSAKQK